MHDTKTEAPKQYQCRHIFTDGRRCASPCLRQEEFCYYHHTTRKPVADPRQRRSRRSTFHLPLPEDRSAIQSAIGQVLQRIASNEIDPRRAGLLLYGLQIASLNLGKTQPATETSGERETVVEEITIDPTLGVLAPRAEVSKTATRKSSVALLIDKFIQKQEEERKSAQPHQPTEPAILPTLQATEDALEIVCPPRNPKRCTSNRVNGVHEIFPVHAHRRCRSTRRTRSISAPQNESAATGTKRQA